MVVPAGTPFSRLESKIIYNEKASDGNLADIVYYLDDCYVGNCKMIIMDTGDESVHFGSIMVDTSADKKVTFINVKKILPYIGLAAAMILFIILMIYVIRAYNFGNAMSRRMNIKKRRKRYHSDFDDIDF